MKKIILENVRLMILATVFSLGLGIAFAWTDPASAPPTGNALTPLNRSASPQVKAGGLWASSFGVDNGLVVMGNLGVGTLNPAEKLSVVGTVESTSGGFKFPDGTVQTTAAVPYVAPPTTSDKFGGIYSKRDGACSNANPFTSACSCPTGYTDNTFLSFSTNASYSCGWHMGYTNTGPCGKQDNESHQCFKL